MTGFQFDLLHTASGKDLGPDAVVAGVSWGNDSVALIQWLVEAGHENVTCLYNDTGWSMPAYGNHEAWLDRVARMEEWARSLGFRCDRTVSMGMEELVAWKQGWPRQGIQFCTEHLKIIPTQIWLAEHDPQGRALCMNGKRRAEGVARANTPEWIDVSVAHGNRMLRQPLFAHTDEMRDDLIRRAGHEVLPFKSRECACINSGAEEILRWPEETVARIERLEAASGRTMFRPARKMGATGIREILEWAAAPVGKFKAPERAAPEVDRWGNQLDLLDDGTGPAHACDVGMCRS